MTWLVQKPALDQTATKLQYKEKQNSKNVYTNKITSDETKVWFTIGIFYTIQPGNVLGLYHSSRGLHGVL